MIPDSDAFRTVLTGLTDTDIHENTQKAAWARTVCQGEET